MERIPGHNPNKQTIKQRRMNYQQTTKTNKHLTGVVYRANLLWLFVEISDYCVLLQYEAAKIVKS
jgi:hypothetical protein